MATWAAEMEAIVAKDGAELFREFIRHFSEVDVEDYYKNGTWSTEQMRIDLHLVLQHRREAGAPEPPPLEEVTLPELPQPKAIVSTGTISFPGTQIGIGGATAAAGSSLVEELKEMAQFIAKIKGDPLKSKSILAKLPPIRRKYVIQNFPAPEAGADSTAALEVYVEQCGKENKWPAAPVTAVGALANKVAIGAAGTVARSPILLGGGAPAAAVTGIKRPISIGGLANDPNKRPAMMIGGARPAMVVGGGVRPAIAARPVFGGGAPAGVRPVIRLFAPPAVAATW